MSRTHASTTEQAPVSHAPIAPAPTQVPTSNSDALAAMDHTTDAGGSYLDGLDGVAPEHDELKHLEKLASQPDIPLITSPELSGSHKLAQPKAEGDDSAVAIDNISAKTDLKSVEGKYQIGTKEGDRARANHVGGKVDRDRTSISLGGVDRTETDGKGSGSAWSVGADSEGNVNGAYTVGPDDRATTLRGNVKLGEDGSLERVDAAVGQKLGKYGVTASASIEPETIETEGRTVSWKSALSASLEGDYGAASIGGEASGRKAQTRTFATEEEAKAFAQKLEIDPQDNRDLDFAAMQPDTAVTFFIEKTLSGNGGAGLLSGELGGSWAQKFDVRCTADNQLDVTIDNEALTQLGGEAQSGMLGVGLDLAGESRAKTRLRIDTTSPAALQALDALIDGGQLDPSVEIPGLQFGMETDDRTCWGGKQDLAIAKLTSKSCEGEGAYRDFDTGEHGKLHTAHDAESESGYFDWFSGLFGYDRSGERGSSSRDTKVYDPELIDGKGGMHMVLKQELAYQQQEVARRLHDQVTPQIDREGISASQLPSPDAPGMRDDQRWFLETVIDAEGTQNVVDALKSGDQSFEWDAQRVLTHVREGLTSGSLSASEAITAFSKSGGEDAHEGMTHLAGEAHRERYLMQEGSDVWIGRAANEKLDKRIAKLGAMAETDADARGELLLLLAGEEGRSDRLGETFADNLGGKGPGIPFDLIVEELNRATEREIAIQRVLDGVQQ